MSMQQIREQYNLPAAKRGARIRVDGRMGTVIGSSRSAMHLRVRLDDGDRVWVHPTWRTEFNPSEER